ncbi:hypothetical protein RSOL_155910, partial [Rhizoctonia solani AG-3 Rhs1AP]
MPGILAKRVLLNYSDECFIGKRQKTLATLSDEHAWDYDDRELIDAAKLNMRLPAYPHYDIRVEKVMGTAAGKLTRSHPIPLRVFHQQEVEYLCPGTKLPSSMTLSRNIKLIHTQFMPKIREYFVSIYLMPLI